MEPSTIWYIIGFNLMIAILVYRIGYDHQLKLTDPLQLFPIIYMIGAIFIVNAILVHIICLATAHYVGADGSDFTDKLDEIYRTRFPPYIAPSAEEALKSTIDSLEKGSLHYGLWEVCEHAKGQCLKWTDMNEKMAKRSAGSFEVPAWLKGAQIMAILGLLATVATGVIAAVHLFSQRTRDRYPLRLVLAYIGAFVSGAIILCGDIMIAVKYDTIYGSILGGMQVPKTSIDFIQTLFFLSWGFTLDVVSAALMMSSVLFFELGAYLTRKANMT